MYKNIFSIVLLLSGWYMIHTSFFNSEMIIDMNRNNTYAIRSGQIAKFTSTATNSTISCILSSSYMYNDIDILLYKVEIPNTHYVILNRTIRYSNPLTQDFYPTESIHHIGTQDFFPSIHHISDKIGYLLIDCETSMNYSK